MLPPAPPSPGFLVATVVELEAPPPPPPAIIKTLPELIADWLIKVVLIANAEYPAPAAA